MQLNEENPRARLPRRKVFTVVRLSDQATVDIACRYAQVKRSEVHLVLRIGEELPKDLHDEFRIISFDGRQITISEKVDGERRVRGFSTETAE